MNTPEEKPLNITAKFGKKTFKEKIIDIKKNVTIEPILMCYIVPRAFAQLATQNLNIDKACRVNMAYGDEICNALLERKGEMYIKEELEIQEFIAKMESWKNILLTVIPIFIMIFLGSWSDKTGKRKFCILMPIVGELLVCLSNILNVYFFYELRVEVTMFLEAIFPAITGGWMDTGANAYIASITSERSRTFRLGIICLCGTTGRPLGYLLSGLLMKKIGFYGVFSLSSSIYVCALIYGWYFVKEPEGTIAGDLEKSTSIWSKIKTFFDITHIKDTIKLGFKSGPNGRRAKFILVITCVVFVIGPFEGEIVVKYLFTRYCFNWDAQMYSFYNFFYICIHTLGVLISITWFSRRLKYDDSVLGIIASISKILGSIAVAFAGSTRDMYIAVILEAFTITFFVLLRSTASKLVSSDDQGKMTTLITLVEMAGTAAFSPVYSMLYSYTVSVYSTTVFLLSAVLTIPTLVIFGWFYIQHKRTLREYKRSCIQEFADPS